MRFAFAVVIVFALVMPWRAFPPHRTLLWTEQARDDDDVTLFGAWGPIERGAPALQKTFGWEPSMSYRTSMNNQPDSTKITIRHAGRRL